MENLPVNFKSQQPVQLVHVGAGDYGSEDGNGNLRDYVSILLRRKWWIIGVFLFFVLSIGLYTFTRTPIYRASAILQIVQDNPSIMGATPDPFAALTSFDTVGKFYETQYKILNSRPLAAKIVDSLNLKDHPDFKDLGKKEPPDSPQQIRSGLIGMVLAGLEVKPIKNTFLVEVAYKSPNKELAQQVANTTYKEYLQFSMETRQQSYSMIREWLEGELLRLGGKVETSHRKLFSHGQQKDFLGLEGEDNVIVKKFVELSQLLTKAQSERMARAAQYQQIKEKGIDAPVVLNNQLILSLRGQIITQEGKTSGDRKIYGRNYPQLQQEVASLDELRSRLNNEYKRLQTSVKADYEVALRTENFLREEVERQKGKVGGFQDNLVEHHILKRDLQTNEQLYQGLLARMKEASVASTMVPSNAAVIEPAELPEYPFSPKTMRNMALAVFLGLAGGVALAFLVEYLDSSIKTTEEVERVCRLPSLGVVPFLPAKDLNSISGQVGLITYEKPKSILSEAIQQVTTALMLSLSDRPPAAIMVTSPGTGEGKSTVSVNLACSLALNGRKVVVVDADMRRPSISHIFGQNGGPGLSNVLAGSIKLSEVLQATAIPNLYFIPAGSIPPNPVQLLNSRGFTDLIRELREDFQHLIIDTPPIIGFADGRAISSQVDGVLMVFKHHKTSRENGRLASQLLSQVNANILGVVLNMVLTDKLGYGGYYGYYKYYSSYYAAYRSDDPDHHENKPS